MMDATEFGVIYDLVRFWGSNRRILTNGTIEGQAKKTKEEAGELYDAAVALREARKLGQSVNSELALLRDGVGDVLVTLVMVCELAQLDMAACFREAYNEIKTRRGEMGPDGIFYKVGSTMPDGRVVE